MHDTSQNLAIYVDDEGNPTRGATREDLAGFYRELWEAFEDSPTGQALLGRGGPDIMSRVNDMFAQRYANTPPNRIGYFEALSEVGSDILLMLPEPVAPKPTPRTAPAPVAVVSPEDAAKAKEAAEAEAKRIGKLKQFAYMVNEQTMRDGVQSLKPRAGMVTLHINGRVYEYGAAEFDALYGEAQEKGFLR
jgi:hypothetical protein